ncbi:MAG TPA: hypothetical protein VN688_02015 [Gemmataceae bacterium]|nr:hypothetical protein [Gemmataceae bacterium]
MRILITIHSYESSGMGDGSVNQRTNPFTRIGMNTFLRDCVNICPITPIGNRSNDALTSMSHVGIASDGQCSGVVFRERLSSRPLRAGLL